MRELVTTFSLRLGLYFRGVGNCIELRSILWRCKVRDRENLAGSAPRYPLFANHLIQKKESISRLLSICDPVGARTQNLQLRRLLLYPVELRNQSYFRVRAVVQRRLLLQNCRKSNTKNLNTQKIDAKGLDSLYKRGQNYPINHLYNQSPEL